MGCYFVPGLFCDTAEFQKKFYDKLTEVLVSNVKGVTHLQLFSKATNMCILKLHLHLFI